MIFGFTGTRKGMTRYQKEQLKELLLASKPTRVNHGDCIGADAEFHNIVKEYLPDCEIFIYPCNIREQRAFCQGAKFILNEAPPLTRNRNIVCASHELVACPKTNKEELRSGTWSTIRYAVKMAVGVHILNPK